MFVGLIVSFERRCDRAADVSGLNAVVRIHVEVDDVFTRWWRMGTVDFHVQVSLTHAASLVSKGTMMTSGSKASHEHVVDCLLVCMSSRIIILKVR